MKYLEKQRHLRHANAAIVYPSLAVCVAVLLANHFYGTLVALVLFGGMYLIDRMSTNRSQPRLYQSCSVRRATNWKRGAQGERWQQLAP